MSHVARASRTRGSDCAMAAVPASDATSSNATNSPTKAANARRMDGTSADIGRWLACSGTTDHLRFGRTKRGCY